MCNITLNLKGSPWADAFWFFDSRKCSKSGLLSKEMTCLHLYLSCRCCWCTFQILWTILWGYHEFCARYFPILSFGHGLLDDARVTVIRCILIFFISWKCSMCWIAQQSHNLIALLSSCRCCWCTCHILRTVLWGYDAFCARYTTLFLSIEYALHDDARAAEFVMHNLQSKLNNWTREKHIQKEKKKSTIQNFFQIIGCGHLYEAM